MIRYLPLSEQKSLDSLKACKGRNHVCCILRNLLWISARGPDFSIAWMRVPHLLRMVPPVAQLDTSCRDAQLPETEMQSFLACI